MARLYRITIATGTFSNVDTLDVFFTPASDITEAVVKADEILKAYQMELIRAGVSQDLTGLLHVTNVDEQCDYIDFWPGKPIQFRQVRIQSTKEDLEDLLEES